MNRMIINDSESGMSIDMMVTEDLPKDVAAKRFLSGLEILEYHRFQDRGTDAETEYECSICGKPLRDMEHWQSHHLEAHFLESSKED